MFKHIYSTSLIIFLFSIASLAQIPDHFVNLKVLPSDISKDELVSVMRSFASGLGVRCNFCHVEGEGQGLGSMNFVSDEKDNKKKARIMMEMVHELNTKYLPELSEFSKDIIKVKCVTCHRGATEPQSLEDVLFEVVKSKGLPEAISTYHQLHDRYYGGFAYDFRDHSLVSLSEMLSDSSMFDAALAFDSLNIKMYPESGTAYFGLAEAYEKKGDKENAIKYYQKSIELNPRSADFINRRIEALKNE
ncbi:MAG: c-type cytochrome [Ignavibacteriaceae bacterium]